MALFKECHIGLTPDQAQVRNLLQKRLRTEETPLCQGCPESQAALKRRIDGQRFAGFNPAIRTLGRVIQLTVSRMPRARIVRCCAAFKSRPLESLHQQQAQVRVESMQE